MHLMNISHPVHYFILRLIPGCPTLEELLWERKYELSYETKFLDRAYKICVTTLKRLSITLTEAESPALDYFNIDETYLLDCDYELEINTPALEYFNFEGNVRDIKIHENLDNLVQANVKIWTLKDDDVLEECYFDGVFQFLAALKNVKFLSFLFCGTKVRTSS
jgi:hypothetical protein